MASKSRAKAHLVFALLTLAAAALVFALLTCLPQGGSPSGSPAANRGDGSLQDDGRANGVIALPPASSDAATSIAEAPQTPSGQVEGGPERLASAQPSPFSRPKRTEKVGRMAIIIDDAGYSLEDLEPFLRFPQALTIAVLPNLPHSAEAARRVREAGKGLLLHCPMEPQNGEDPGPGALRTDQTDAEIKRLLDSAFDSVPGAEGLNNHMGSKATADERLMSVVLSYLKARGLYFVDSRTTPDSVAAGIAAELSVPFLQRNVFMDNVRDAPDIEKSLAAGASEAAAQGKSILIGHVHTPEILAILSRNLPGLEESGIGLVRLSEILE